jgi:hypothetical protein
MERAIERFAPLAGIAAVVLLIASVLGVGTTPALDEPASDVVDYFENNAGQVRFSIVLAALSAIALLVFASRLSAAMREHGGLKVLPGTAFAGGIVAATGSASTLRCASQW